MRLIDADALMREINEGATDGTIANYVRGVLAATLDRAPTVDAEQVRQWISVKDRLPNMSGDYIVARKDGVVFIEFFEEQEAQWYDEDFGIDYCITHWMPLPEPPKEKDDEQTD